MTMKAEEVESANLDSILTKLSEKITLSCTSRDKLDKINSLTNDVKQSRRQYQENELLIKSVKRICAAAGEDSSSAIKIADRIIAVTDAMRLSDANHKDIGNILGFDKNWLKETEPVMSSKDAKALQAAVERDLRRKYGKMAIPVGTLESSSEDAWNEERMLLLRTLNKEFETCHELLSSERRIYEDLWMLRQLNLDIANQKTLLLQGELRLTALKAKIVDATNATSLYLGDKNTLETLMLIKCDLHKEMMVSEERLKKLESDIEQYGRLQEDERYVNVLKDYRAIMRFIGNKKLALGQC